MKKIAVRMPAEWEKQRALLLTWPIEQGLWKQNLPAAVQVFIQIALQAAHFQPVIVSCFDEPHKRHIQDLLQAHPQPKYPIHLYTVPSNDSWTRDHGPITVYDDHQTAILRKFIFNGWGNKYPHERDNQLVNHLATLGAFGTQLLENADWILEGGSVETDGQHTLLTTESCLLNSNRNSSFTREEIERRLQSDLGMDRVLWIKNSFLAGDDTDGHIDMLARFCDPQTICYATPHPADTANQASLLGLADELRALRTRTGEAYQLVPLPPIQPKFNAKGDQLPASYANFLIINEAVLVPTYEDASDTLALTCLQHRFPHRKIIGIPALALIKQYGSIHCATMNLYI